MKDMWLTDGVRGEKGNYKLLEKKRAAQERRSPPLHTKPGPAVCPSKS